MDEVPAIWLRENERGQQIGAGWTPHGHRPTDLFASCPDKNFLLGSNAAQTTLAAIRARQSKLFRPDCKG